MGTPVQTRGNGWYQAVSETVGSPVLQKSELSQLWAANPDLADTQLPAGLWAKAARVIPVVAESSRFAYAPAKTAVADVLFNPLPTGLQEAVDLLSSYPIAAPTSVPTVPGSEPKMMITSHTPNGQGVRVYFSLEETDKAIPQMAILETRAPEHRFYDQRWLIPALSEGQVLSPLMLWWALLFGLSMLARYHPDEWVTALEVNTSRLSVPLDDALEIAQSAVPHLVLEALLRVKVKFNN